MCCTLYRPSSLGLAMVSETAVDDRGNSLVSVDPRYFRPTEVETLLGDASKSKKGRLGWVRK